MNKEFDHNNVSEEFDLNFDTSKILNIFARNKILLSSFTLVFFILSCIYSFTKKRIWEGQFQIVVREEKKSLNSTFLSSNPLISQALNFGGNQASNLKTEVGILESSSVLMPVFEFFKEEKIKLNKELRKITFTSWKKNLGLELKKNTSILNISFRDNDKVLINSVLDKIIYTYQEYSGKSKKRNLELSSNYLDQQINLYKRESLNSMKVLQEFAIDQDLTAIEYGLKTKPKRIDLLYQQEPNYNESIFGNSVSIEKARVSAANEIRNIEARIKKIESSGIDSDAIAFFDLTANSSESEEDLIPSLSEINFKLSESKVIYTEKDPEIIKLKKRREILINLIKQKAINFLKAKKVEAEAILEATTRPKGVLLKYKELARKANADDSTLVELENQKRSISLQKAKLEDPWELITKPTIKSSPVAPRKKLIVGFGTILGLIFGVLAAVFKERKTGLIFEEDTIESILNVKIIDNIKLNNPKSNLFINALFEQKKENSFKFIYPDHLKKINPKFLKDIFENQNYNSSIVNDLIDIEKDDILILVTSLKKITFNELLKIKNQLEILEKSLFGIVIVEE